MINIGLEKETLLFNEDFTPKNLTVDDLGPGVTLDFYANQVEINTASYSCINKLIEDAYLITNKSEVVNYCAWPLSQPKKIEKDAKVANLSEPEYEYRKYLKDKYSEDLLGLVGIHLNIDRDICVDPNDCFELMKKLYVYGPILLQFFGFTPVYGDHMQITGLEDIDKNRGLKNSLSLRTSDQYGFMNEVDLNLDFHSLESYFESIDRAVENSDIIDSRELYSRIKIKENKEGNCYLELRFIDINPYYQLGISYEQLVLFEKFIEFLSITKVDNFNYKVSLDNFNKVSLYGKDKETEVIIDGDSHNLEIVTNELFKNMLNELQLTEFESIILEKFIDDYNNNDLDVDKMIGEMKDNNYSVDEFGIKYSRKKEIFTPSYPDQDLELSTKILMNKIDEIPRFGYSVLDEYANVLEIEDKDNKSFQYVVQATKTNKDSYANVLLMENKVMTKMFLRKNNIKVARDVVVERGLDMTEMISQIKAEFKGEKIVIKPYDTNFGLGISIIDNYTDLELENALEQGFKYSPRVIVEEYFAGEEYRFLVVNDEVTSVVKRIPANVQGDGKSTILQLIEAKNSEVTRGKNYKTPLEKIEVDEIMINYLKKKKLTIESIIPAGEMIYLRENSNVSTGGEPLEVFDLMPNYFKDIAIGVAKSMDVAICGVDIIINAKNEYIVVEANFNPAIQIHTYPYLGIGRNPSGNILDLLFDN